MATLCNEVNKKMNLIFALCGFIYTNLNANIFIAYAEYIQRAQ